MNLEDQSFDVIHSRILADVPDTFDKRQGSVVYDMTAPTAAEAELVYALMATLLDRGFADTAEGEDLERRVAEQGITRKPAVKATGAFTATGTNGFVVAAGTVVKTALGVRFVTDSSATIAGGSVSIPVTAETGGAAGNVDANTIVYIEGNLSGVTGVTNPAATTGGIDAENDQSLYDRYIEKVSLPATSGNAYHYIQTAKEVSGIQDARVFPLWSGPGTVRVVVAGNTGAAVPTTKVNEVAAHIEAMRPIGATVTVTAAAVVGITVVATVAFDPAYAVADVRAEIISKVTSYLGTLGLTSGAVLYSQVMKAIVSTEGVLDCSSLIINGSAANVTISDDAMPVVSGVTVNAAV